MPTESPTFQVLSEASSLARVAGMRTYLTVTEVAAMLGLCERTVYELLRAGRMQGTRFGRTWRVKREWVEAAGRPNAA